MRPEGLRGHGGKCRIGHPASARQPPYVGCYTHAGGGTHVGGTHVGGYNGDGVATGRRSFGVGGNQMPDEDCTPGRTRPWLFPR